MQYEGSNSVLPFFPLNLNRYRVKVGEVGSPFLYDHSIVQFRNLFSLFLFDMVLWEAHLFIKLHFPPKRKVLLNKLMHYINTYRTSCSPKENLWIITFCDRDSDR